MTSDLAKAMAWALLGAFLFAVMFMLPKLAGEAVPPLQVAFLRYLAGFCVILPFFLRSYGLHGVLPEIADPAKRRLNLTHLLRGCFGIGGVALGAYAVTQIPLANAQAIAMTNGVFAVVLAALFLRERMSTADIVAGCVCLAGAVVVAGPDPAAPGWVSLGALAALAQAFTWGSELVLLRFAAVRDRPERALTLVNGAACVILLAAMAWLWRPIPAIDTVILLAMGPVAIVGQACNMKAFSLASTAQMVPVSYSGLVFAALLGLAVFGEWPRPAAIAGAAMIVGGAIYLARHKPLRPAMAPGPGD
ncbi:MAG: DMT family transporter [Kiloniellaceae bacterium]